MVALDTNILVYAYRPELPFHRSALRILSQLMNGDATWALTYQVLHEFYSVLTNPRLFAAPSTPDEAIRAISVLLASPSAVLIGETEGHFAVLERLLTSAAVLGPMVHDARIVAICICHGVDELYSADRDFSRFSEHLNVTNPCNANET